MKLPVSRSAFWVGLAWLRSANHLSTASPAEECHQLVSPVWERRVKKLIF